MSFFNKPTTFTGTVQQAISAGVAVNNTKVDGVSMSILKNFGMVEEVGQADKPEGRRGRSAKIYKITSKPGFTVTWN